MKILDLINEAETDKEKNRRHQKDLDDLERDIRKSGSMDKETEKAINTKRMQLAKQRMSETTTAGSVASVATPVGGLVSRQNNTGINGLDSDNLLGGPAKKKKKKKSKR